MSWKLLRITSSYFCAGVGVVDDIAVNTAPILKYMNGRSLWWIKKYCEKKKWELEVYDCN
jgi:hypothetical protein